MPELPELEVVRDVLQRRVVGQSITAVQVIPPVGPVVVRDLIHQGFEIGLAGRLISSVARRGKFMIFNCQDASQGLIYLVLNPKLSGRLQMAAPTDRRMAKTGVIFSLDSGLQLRYFDQKQMGQLYLASSLDLVPGFSGMGPEALEITYKEFYDRIRPFRGEIKGVLTRGDFVAGIGNAYADEILWKAHLHPYLKRSRLKAEDIERLYSAMRITLTSAIEKVRAAMGEHIEREPRDFMAVHMKTGQPCPRCGTPISMVGANQRITNFCRTCQPGGLIKGM
jgi:formamidopyrimidine-DNA glycosylase